MTKVRSMQKGGQRSRSQRSQPNLTVSGKYLQFEFTYDDEMMHIAWCCLEEVPYCFSRSSVKFQGHTALKIVKFDPDWAFPDCNSSLNSPMAKKWCTKLEVALKRCPFVFSCDQAALQMVFSVCPSVCLSVRLSVRLSVTPFSPCSHHRIIMKFSGVITMVKSDVHAKGQGQRSKVKVTEVNTQLSRFRTLTPVWIHVWQWNHAHSWKQHRRGALLFFKVNPQISRSHGSKNRRIWPRLGVSGL